MTDNPFLEQLLNRVGGDRLAMRRTQDIFRAMLDRKLWRQMKSSEDLPLS